MLDLGQNINIDSDSYTIFQEISTLHLTYFSILLSAVKFELKIEFLYPAKKIKTINPMNESGLHHTHICNTNTGCIFP